LASMLQKFSTILFDCDGVIFDSNSVKTDAFFKIALPYGLEKANCLKMYHIKNGGISRFEKVRYFIERIAKNIPEAHKSKKRSKLLQCYENYVRPAIATCPIAERLTELRAATSAATWMVVSGGLESELHEIFKSRMIDTHFNGGIYGSPSSKPEIIRREIDNGRITFPAVYLGDSKYDYDCAKHFGLHFIFVSEWTEMDGWENFVIETGCHSVRKLSCLL